MASRLGRAASHGIAALVGVLVVLPDVVGLGNVTPFVQLVSFRAPLVLLLLPALVLLWPVLRFRPRWLAAPLVVVAVAAALVAPRLIADPAPPAGGPALRVLSLNVNNGSADPVWVASAIRQFEPDLVVLPEAGDRFVASVRAARPDLRYRVEVGGPPGEFDGATTAVLVAPRLDGPTLRATERRGALFSWVGLEGGALPATVLAVHTAAPVPGQTARWSADLAALTGPCRSGAPVLLVGDFNATLDNPELREVARGCRDAAASLGHGLTGTWPTAAPRGLAVQIDHVLAGDGLVPSTLEVFDVPRSDHRALLVTLRVARP